MIKAEGQSVVYWTRLNNDVKIQFGEGVVQYAYNLGGEQWATQQSSEVLYPPQEV